MAYPPPPYKDAVVGTFVAGEAIVGRWWAYPPQAGLGLQGHLPSLTIDMSVRVFPPQAGLGLAAFAPALRLDSVAAVPSASLGLQAVPFTLTIHQRLVVPQSGLGLAAVPPDRVGQPFLPLPPVLVFPPASVCAEEVFVPLACEDQDWIPSKAEAI